MSKGLFVVLLILAGIGYYFYKINWFTEISAKFDYTADSVSVVAQDFDLHDCNLSLTHDFKVEIPTIRTNQRVTFPQTDFKQWNGTILESMKDLGPQIEFKMRCDEGKIERKEANRYAFSEPVNKQPADGEVVESN